MGKDDIELILTRKPFTPVRLHFSNGSTHDITHPDGILLSEKVAAIAIGDSIWLVALSHLVEIEPLASVIAR
jgi:hypothetical protein